MSSPPSPSGSLVDQCAPSHIRTRSSIAASSREESIPAADPPVQCQLVEAAVSGLPAELQQIANRKRIGPQIPLWFRFPSVRFAKRRRPSEIEASAREPWGTCSLRNGFQRGHRQWLRRDF